jgi:hypothetical protein
VGPTAKRDLPIGGRWLGPKRRALLTLIADEEHVDRLPDSSSH